MRLENYEIACATWVGERREEQSVHNGWTPRFDPSTTRAKNILGAMGEMCFAKALGRYWNASVGVGKRPDFPPNIQIRTSPRLDGEMYVKRHENPEEIFVLVVGTPPFFYVVGGMRGALAKRPQW